MTHMIWKHVMHVCDHPLLGGHICKCKLLKGDWIGDGYRIKANNAELKKLLANKPKSIST